MTTFKCDPFFSFSKEALMRNTSVGIRDAKAHLSRYLKLVQKGEEVIITDHGQPVGKIVPMASMDLTLQDRIVRLVEARGFGAPRRRAHQQVAAGPAGS
jgi:prevent-host-death family protein